MTNWVASHRPGTVLRPIGLDAEWAKQEYLVEPNDVLEHATGVPVGAGGRSFPPLTHLLNNGSESVAGPPVAVDRPVFWVHVDLLLVASYSGQSSCASGTPTDRA